MLMQELHDMIAGEATVPASDGSGPRVVWADLAAGDSDEEAAAAVPEFTSEGICSGQPESGAAAEPAA